MGIDHIAAAIFGGILTGVVVHMDAEVDLKIPARAGLDSKQTELTARKSKPITSHGLKLRRLADSVRKRMVFRTKIKTHEIKALLVR